MSTAETREELFTRRRFLGHGNHREKLWMKIHGASLTANVEEPVDGEISPLPPERSANAFGGGFEPTRRWVLVKTRANRLHGDARTREPRIELLAHEALNHERSPGVSDEDAALKPTTSRFAKKKLMVDELVGDGLNFSTCARAGGVDGGLYLSDGDAHVADAGIQLRRLRERRRRLEEQQE